MAYNIGILKKMIEVLDRNIKMFEGYYKLYEGYENQVWKEQKIRANEARIAEMRSERKVLEDIIANGGNSIPGVYIDSMTYSALAGADTSWWTRGT